MCAETLQMSLAINFLLSVFLIGLCWRLSR